MVVDLRTNPPPDWPFAERRAQRHRHTHVFGPEWLLSEEMTIERRYPERAAPPGPATHTAQEVFAAFAGIIVRTVQAWERRHWQRTRRVRSPLIALAGKKFAFGSLSNPAKVLIALVAAYRWIIHDIMTGGGHGLPLRWFD